MFSNIRQGVPVYLLDKVGQNGPVLKIGQVEQVSQLQPKHQTYTPGINIGLPNLNEMVINIRVKFDDGPRDFNQIPANLSLQILITVQLLQIIVLTLFLKLR